VGQKHETFREFRTPFPPRDIRKNPRSVYARVPQVMAQFVLKIELLSHIMGTTPILEMARAYGLRPRLWLLILFDVFSLVPSVLVPIDQRSEYERQASMRSKERRLEIRDCYF